MKIVCHCLVKNEENFIWYAINSVIDYMDEVMVWDMQSTDRTAEIVKSITNGKVTFREIENIKVEIARQQMLEQTNSDWIFILDGDEVWHGEAISNLKKTITMASQDVRVIATPNYMLIGDIYHHQEEKAGKYKIGEKVGHYNIRAFKKTAGIHIEGTYPLEAIVNNKGTKLQDLDKNIIFLDTKYLHASFLKRSPKRFGKVKYEIGEEFSCNYFYPEVFFRPKPNIVPDVWRPMDKYYFARSIIETPFKKIKRRIYG